MDVFLVQHVHKVWSGEAEEEEVKTIGIYASRKGADEAVARLVTQPGFSDHPEGFRIDRYELDKDHWAEGFVAV
jgi:hypothetical protein